MNYYPPTLARIDPKEQQKRALAKVYNLLIRLAEERAKGTAGTVKGKVKSALLKSNIHQGKYNSP